MLQWSWLVFRCSSVLCYCILPLTPIFCEQLSGIFIWSQNKVHFWSNLHIHNLNITSKEMYQLTMLCFCKKGYSAQISVTGCSSSRIHCCLLIKVLCTSSLATFILGLDFSTSCFNNFMCLSWETSSSHAIDSDGYGCLLLSQYFTCLAGFLSVDLEVVRFMFCAFVYINIFQDCC